MVKLMTNKIYVKLLLTNRSHNCKYEEFNTVQKWIIKQLEEYDMSMFSEINALANWSADNCL